MVKCGYLQNLGIPNAPAFGAMGCNLETQPKTLSWARHSE
jgi:hypothetical protein